MKFHSQHVLSLSEMKTLALVQTLSLQLKHQSCAVLNLKFS